MTAYHISLSTALSTLSYPGSLEIHYICTRRTTISIAPFLHSTRTASQVGPLAWIPTHYSYLPILWKGLLTASVQNSQIMLLWRDVLYEESLLCCIISSLLLETHTLCRILHSQLYFQVRMTTSFWHTTTYRFPYFTEARFIYSGVVCCTNIFQLITLLPTALFAQPYIPLLHNFSTESRPPWEALHTITIRFARHFSTISNSAATAVPAWIARNWTP